MQIICKTYAESQLPNNMLCLQYAKYQQICNKYAKKMLKVQINQTTAQIYKKYTRDRDIAGVRLRVGRGPPSAAARARGEAAARGSESLW